MIKQLLHFILRLFIIIICIAASATVFLRWIGYFDTDTFVAYLYDDTTFHLIEIDQMTALFEESETDFQSAPLYGDTTERVAQMIEKGANTIILNLATTPTDSLISLAAEQDVTLFFVGALPTDEQIASYDKLWCFTQSPAYAGELLGEQVALGFRAGSIVDKNEDLLLDYVFLNNSETYMQTTDAIETTLLELDHYGVYTTDVYAAAYNSALFAAELLANSEAEESDAEDAAIEEYITDETSDADALLTDDIPEEEVVTAPLSISVDFADLASAEILLSIGSENVNYLVTQATLQGWNSSDISFACIVENQSTAQALAETELYHTIVYFDTLTATQTVVAMARNALTQTPVTNDTEYAENDAHTFVIHHLIY